MPEGELQAFEDAIEWVGNPDHEFDARVFHGLDCTLHVLPAPHPTPWIALARRTNPEATVPFMLFFLGTGRVVYQLAVPLCVRDEDLDGQDVLTPPCLATRAGTGTRRDPLRRGGPVDRGRGTRGQTEARLPFRHDGMAVRLGLLSRALSGGPMLHEDPPDLADDGGVILAQVAGRDEHLGRRPVEMRAVVGDEAVAPAGLRAGRAGPR